jgi:5-methyltetrahydropteroyltriglutamate--homocysteine methyltransferase
MRHSRPNLWKFRNCPVPNRLRQRFATEIVGSYYKPHWLLNHATPVSGASRSPFVPPREVLDEAKQAAVRLAIDDQERAGLDVVTDGEQTRASFVGHFYRLQGIDTTRWKQRQRSTSDYQTVEFKTGFATRTAGGYPVVSGPIRRTTPLILAEARFARRFARAPLKVTIVGPFTLACRLVDEHYGDFKILLADVADALNDELRDLDREGVALLQLDEPDLHFQYSEAERSGAVDYLDRALHGLETATAVHICYGYSAFIERKWVNPTYTRTLDLLRHSSVDQISLEYEEPGHGPDVLSHVGSKVAAVGMLSMGNAEAETAQHIVERARAAAEVVPPERLKLSSDCGMWFLDHDVAFAKISNLASAARMLRDG